MFDIDFEGIFDDMLDRMQMPRAKQAVREAFNAAPKEPGKAAPRCRVCGTARCSAHRPK